MAENKKITWRMVVPEILCILITGAGVYGIGWVKHTATDILLSCVVLSVVGAAIVGFQLRQAYLEEELDYDNGRYYNRFWICYFIGFLVAVGCSFLPVAGWPYLTIFVSMALFSNMSTGILSASVLLSISVLLGGAPVSHFVLYFLTGLFGISMFRHLDDGFKIGMKMFLSLLCLLLCQTATVVLLANERLSVESFVIPVANVAISGILLLGILLMFSSLVIFKYRVKYLELNDTENPILAEYRNNSKSEYMHSVHTAYFCERIANKLALDVETLKCAGYFHKIVEARPELLEEHQFPPAVKKLLLEYFDKKAPLQNKETAVLMCSDTMMNTIQILITKSEGQGLDYDYIIDNVFKRFEETEAFVHCDISVKELEMMKKIFKGEKLYYDFLR